MLRNTLVSGILSVAIGITSMPAIAAPLAPSMPQFDNPTVTEVGRRWRRGHARWRGHRNRVVVNRWRGGRHWRRGCWNCGWDNDFDGFGVATAGIIGFGLGAALAAPYYRGYYGGRRCYVDSGGIRYVVDCASLY